jgi:hypothetical protein
MLVGGAQQTTSSESLMRHVSQHDKITTTALQVSMDKGGWKDKGVQVYMYQVSSRPPLIVPYPAAARDEQEPSWDALHLDPALIPRLSDITHIISALKVTACFTCVNPSPGKYTIKRSTKSPQTPPHPVPV